MKLLKKTIVNDFFLPTINVHLIINNLNFLYYVIIMQLIQILSILL